MKTFLENTTVHETVKREMRKYPQDFRFYSWRGGEVYFYRHSAIEYLFK
jgi:hypothetical protein